MELTVTSVVCTVRCEWSRFLAIANKIGDEGALALASALKSGKTQLKHVYLWGNDIGDEGKAALKPFSKIIDWSEP